MTVYVICANVEWDSYHQVILVTLDYDEALACMEDWNNSHDVYDIQRHLHALPLSGLSPDVRFDKRVRTC